MRTIIGILLTLEILSANYTRDNSLEVVSDIANTIMWQDNSEAKTVKKTWKNALEYCQNLNNKNFAGYSSGWRLPTFNELYSITEHSKKSPAISSAFKNVSTDDLYWSSTTYASADAGAWVVHFYFGDDYYYHKDYSYYVRCVRGQSFEDLTKTKEGGDIVAKEITQDIGGWAKGNPEQFLYKAKLKVLDVFGEVLARKRYALVIGISDYSEDKNNLEFLHSPRKDAQDMHDYFKDYLKFDDVKILQNAEATSDAIRSAIDDINGLSANKDNADLVIYYSGHGVLFNDIACIVPIDASRTKPSKLLKIQADIIDNIDRYKFRHKLFIFDSCYSGNVNTQITGFGWTPKGGKDLKYQATKVDILKINVLEKMYAPGTHILTSSARDRLSFASKGKSWKGNSLYTYHLLKAVGYYKEDGLEADISNDGVVTLPELFCYLDENVPKDKQSPTLKEYPSNIPHEGEFMFYKKEQ